MKKTLAISTSSFRKLRENNNIYVDKTKWILSLVSKEESYFLSRPRRFGKSLTISTLKELFKGNKELFKGLYVQDKWEFKEYPVLIFDFNGINNRSGDKLEQALKTLILEFFKINEIKSPESDDIQFLFKQLIVYLYDKFNEKVVILVDEYDKPIIDHLGKNEIDTAKENREILESLFGVLKDANVVDYLKFVFVTGVSRFSKVSIFSKWNNLTDITMNVSYADFLGYTDEEIKTYFEEYLYEFCEEEGMDIEECLDKLRYHYNGYRFSEERDVKVFNPISIMNSLMNKNFKNYWFSTATPSFLVNLIKEKNYFIPDMENIAVDDSMLESFDIENIRIEAMLFQTGYLTIKDYDREAESFTLSYPNQEVKKSFNKILFDNIAESYGAIEYAKSLGRAFKNESIEDVEFFINAIFNEIPYPHFKNADENYFHTIIYMALSLIGFNTKSELLSSRGRLDLALIFPDKVFVIEFKCNTSAESAINQIKEKSYADKWKNKGMRTFICGISFDTEKRRVKEILFEELI